MNGNQFFCDHLDAATFKLFVEWCHERGNPVIVTTTMAGWVGGCEDCDGYGCRDCALGAQLVALHSRRRIRFSDRIPFEKRDWQPFRMPGKLSPNIAGTAAFPKGHVPCLTLATRSTI